MARDIKFYFLKKWNLFLQQKRNTFLAQFLGSDVCFFRKKKNTNNPPSILMRMFFYGKHEPAGLHPGIIYYTRCETVIIKSV